MNYVKWQKFLVPVAVVLMVVVCEGAAKPEESFYIADAYVCGDPMPIDAHGKEVGYRVSATVKLPADFDASGMQKVLLWLDADDFDSPKEVSIYVNEHGPIKPSAAMIGEGVGHLGYVEVSPSFLRPGENTVSFGFEDNLGGTTKGFLVYDVRLLLVKAGDPVPAEQLDSGQSQRLEQEGFGLMVERLEVEGFGSIVAYDKSFVPKRIKLARGGEFGWKTRSIKKGDGRGGWIYRQAEHMFLGAPNSRVIPYTIIQMDNGEIILAGTWESPPSQPVNQMCLTFSKDSGNTWSDLRLMPIFDRPVTMTYLGKGNLNLIPKGCISEDYGRTWKQVRGALETREGYSFGTEGNAVVDFDDKGLAKRIGLIGYSFLGRKWLPPEPTNCYLRWSTDGGRTWINETSPNQWRYEEKLEGKTYVHSASEGSLVRAANGWLVAALRTDLPVRYVSQPFDDSLEGTGVSVSKDNGKTWSPVKVLYDAGRHHAHLLLLPNGDIVMMLIVRADVRNGRLASCRRGLDAIISHDNGLTWDLSGRYVLDEYEFLEFGRWYNGECGHVSATVLDDGSILACYGNYLSQSTALIRWNPDGKP